MLKNKRINKKNKTITNLKKKKDVLDEEIESLSDEDSLSSNEDDKLNLKEKSKPKTTLEKNMSKSISLDEKRLMMAKTLIDTVGDKEVDEEIQKSKNEYCTELSKNLIIKDNYDFQFIKCHLSGITSITYIDNNSIITTSRDKRSFIIDLNSEKKTLLPEFTDKSLLSSCLSKDKKNVFFVGGDCKVHLYNIESNKIINVLPKAHTDSITKICVDPSNEQVYTVSKDHNLKVWGLNSYNNLIHMETFYGHLNSVYDMDILQTNRLVTCGADANVHQWKIDSQSFLQYKQGDISYESIYAMNKFYFITGDYLGSIKLFNINKKKHIGETYSNKKPTLSFERATNIGEDNYPILSLFGFKNSDLFFTGSTDGNIEAFSCNYNKTNKISKLANINLLKEGIVSVINGNKNTLCVAFSKEGKNGRWDVDYNLKKSGIAIVKLLD